MSQEMVSVIIEQLSNDTTKLLANTFQNQQNELVGIHKAVSDLAGRLQAINAQLGRLSQGGAGSAAGAKQTAQQGGANPSGNAQQAWTPPTLWEALKPADRDAKTPGSAAYQYLRTGVDNVATLMPGTQDPKVLKDIQKSLLDDMEKSYDNHYKKLISGAESFSKAYTGVFRDLATELGVIVLNNIIGKIFNKWFGAADAQTSTNDNKPTDNGSQTKTAANQKTDTVNLQANTVNVQTTAGNAQSSTDGKPQSTGANNQQSLKNPPGLEKSLKQPITNMLQKIIGDVDQGTLDQFWKDTETSISNHYQKLLTGAESFSKAYKGILRDLATEMLTMLTNKVLGNFLNGIFGKSQTASSAQLPSITPVAWDENSEWTSLIGLASGGPVDQNSLYLVGEQGPELFVPSAAGMIVPNHRLSGSRSVITPAAAAAPNVTVNVINKSGSAIEPVQQETKMNGDEYVINVVIDSISRNRYGMRDMISATAKR